MKIPHKALALNVLNDADWLKAHPKVLTESLVSEGRLRHLDKDEWAQTEGDEESGLFIVIDGILHTYYAPGGDRVMMIGFATPGTVLGHTTPYSGGPRLVTAICAEPSILLDISKTALDRIAADTPEIWQAIASLTYNDLQRVLGLAAEFISLKPKHRIAARLLATVQNNRNSNLPVVNISQELLGEMTGVTRKTVNHYLSAFEKDGLIRTGYGRIEIRDMEAMRVLAKG